MIPKHIRNLALLAITIPIFVIIVSYCLGITIDTYDLYYYFDHAFLLSTGVLPYVGVQFDYPPLALVPMAIAILPVLIINSFRVFTVTFIALMLACNAGITICSYYIGLKVYENVRMAHWAAILSTLGLASSYFVVTRFDAFPVFLMMLGITFALYQRDNATGYGFAVLGFFTKLFPAMIIPFTMLYNRNKSVAMGIISMAFAVASIAMFFIFSLFDITRTGFIYANTPLYLLHYMWGVNLYLPVVLSILACGLLIILLYSFFTLKQTPRQFLTYIVVSLMLLVFCMSYHSPQYILWYSPLLAILLADNIMGVLTFLAYQVVAFIDFPVAFNWLWVNNHYVEVYPTIVLFFTEFALMITLGYFVVFKQGETV